MDKIKSGDKVINIESNVVGHEYRDIKIDANTTITIDLVEIAEQIERDFHKHAELGLNYGA